MRAGPTRLLGGGGLEGQEPLERRGRRRRRSRPAAARPGAAAPPARPARRAAGARGTSTTPPPRAGPSRRRRRRAAGSAPLTPCNRLTPLVQRPGDLARGLVRHRQHVERIGHERCGPHRDPDDLAGIVAHDRPPARVVAARTALRVGRSHPLGDRGDHRVEDRVGGEVGRRGLEEGGGIVVELQVGHLRTVAERGPTPQPVSVWERARPRISAMTDTREPGHGDDQRRSTRRRRTREACARGPRGHLERSTGRRRTPTPSTAPSRARTSTRSTPRRRP